MSVLRECDIVENVQVSNEKMNLKQSYELILKADIILPLKKSLPILICIPKRWYMDLIDIYIENYDDIIFIPHVSKNGKLCLFDVEGCLIDKNLEGIVIQSLFRAQELLNKGILKENFDDFTKEFELYLSEYKNFRLAKLVVPKLKENAIIYCQYKKKQEKSAWFRKRNNNSTLYLGANLEDFKRWRMEGVTIVKAAYFILYPKETIYPPDIRKDISLEYLNFLLQCTESEYNKNLLGLSNEKILIFEIIQPNGVCNYIGFRVNEAMIEIIDDRYYFKSCKSIQLILVERSDKEYMIMRTKDDVIQKKRKILVIGCGSIGGHLINQLVRAGYEDLTIVDDDYLTEENIFRHILGMEYVSFPKCEALAEYISKNIPEVSIKTLKEKADEAILEGDLELNDYDMVVSAVGNHNFNRWLNEYVIMNQIKVPIIYAWNEVYGIGNHVAYFKVGNASCYECLFKRDDYSGELYDQTAYCKRGQIIVHSSGGCGKSYVPYGDTISIKTVLICLDIIRGVFENKFEDNILFSMKGDETYFKSRGLEVSARYLNQKTPTIKLSGKELYNCKCGVCNGYK